MAQKLTDGPRGNIAKAAPPERGRRMIYDDHRDAPRGFALRITPTTKTFVLRYYINGHERLLRIGDWPTWSLEAARLEAGQKKREIDGGHDIAQERRDTAAEATVKEAVERYCRARVDKTASAAKSRRYFERDVVPAIGRRKIRSVRRADLIELVEDKAEKTPRAAYLLLTHLKGLFAWAEDREIIDGNPAATIRPGKVSQTMKPRQRARVLDDAEIRAFWTNVETCGMRRLTALALKLILVTGQRPGEVVGMRHGEVKGEVWTIPAERRLKNETAHSVPLTDTALTIYEEVEAEVKRLQRRRRWRVGHDLVFPTGRNKSLTVSGLSQAVNRFVDALGNKNAEVWGQWLPHDLRRTCRTRLAESGISETVAERVIGHGPKGIVGVYDLHRYDAEKRAALETWERRLHAIVTGTSAEVVAITEARA